MAVLWSCESVVAPSQWKIYQLKSASRSDAWFPLPGTQKCFPGIESLPISWPKLKSCGIGKARNKQFNCMKYWQKQCVWSPYRIWNRNVLILQQPNLHHYSPWDRRTRWHSSWLAGLVCGMTAGPVQHFALCRKWRCGNWHRPQQRRTHLQGFHMQIWSAYPEWYDQCQHGLIDGNYSTSLHLTKSLPKHWGFPATSRTCYTSFGSNLHGLLRKHHSQHLLHMCK